MRDTEAVIMLLEQSSEQALDDWLAQPAQASYKTWFDKKSFPALQWRSLIVLADAHLPAKDGWRGLYAMQSHVLPVPSTRGIPVDHACMPMPAVNGSRVFLLEAGALLDRAAQGYDVQGEIQLLMTRQPSTVGQGDVLKVDDRYANLWPLVLCVAQGKPADARLRVFEAAASLLQPRAMSSCSHAAQVSVSSVLLREWLSDRSVVALMPATAIEALLETEGARPQYWPLVKSLSASRKDLAAMLWRALADPSTTDGRRDLDMTAKALGSLQPQPVPWQPNSSGPSIFARAWPPLPVIAIGDADAKDKLQAAIVEHLTVLRSHRHGVQAQSGQTVVTSDEFVPDALRAMWSSSQSWLFTVAQWLEMFAHFMSNRSIISVSTNAPVALQWTPEDGELFSACLPLPLRMADRLDTTGLSEDQAMSALCLGLFTHRSHGVGNPSWLSQMLGHIAFDLPASVLQWATGNAASATGLWLGQNALDLRTITFLLQRGARLFLTNASTDESSIRRVTASLTSRDDAAEISTLWIQLVQQHRPESLNEDSVLRQAPI